MKRKWVLLLAIAVIIVAIVVYFPTPNERIMAGMMDDFLDIIKGYAPDAVVESKEVYGKLNGNGNGIQYFGAALIKTDTTIDIDTLLTELDAEFEIVEAMEQKGQNVESTLLQHRNLTYNTTIANNDQYITVYFYNSNHPKSDLFDIAGH